MNLAVAAEADVETLAPEPVPSSLYLMTSSESGWRKSTVQKRAFKPHKSADSAARKAWQAEKASEKQSDGHVSLLPQEPAKIPPVSLRSDTTVEALLKNLADGRETQGIVSPDAGELLGGWSFSKGQRMQTLARLNKLWDGEDLNYERSEARVSVFIEGRRLTLCLAAQHSIIDELFASKDAENGFSARVLLSMDTSRPQEQEFDWPAGTSAARYVEQLGGIIANARRVQDGSGPRRVLVRPTDDAVQVLRNHHRCWLEQADALEEGHELSFLSRAAEQCARYAANLLAFRCMEANEEIGGFYTAQDVEDAATVINWHYRVLCCLTDGAIRSEYLRAAAAVADKLREEGQAAVRLLPFIGQKAPGAARKFKNDADAKRAIIGLLEEYDYVRRLENAKMKAWYHVNLLDPQ